MKRLTHLSVWLLIAICLGSNSFAALTILSTSTAINSSWTESWLDADSFRHDTSGIGLTSSPHGWARASASADSFSLGMSASAVVSWWQMDDGGYCIGSRIYTSASATTRFSTDCHQLGITLTSSASFNYWADEQDMQVTLTDITAATTLLDIMHLDGPAMGSYFQTQYFNIGVDPAHEYELSLSGWTDAFDEKYVDMEVYFDISELANAQEPCVVAWGYNSSGQTNVPPGLANVVAVTGGLNHSVALQDNGTVVAWGTGVATNVPSGLAGVIQIASKYGHSLALLDNKTVVAWGASTYGQTNVPPGLSNVVAIAAGGYHSLALKSDGTVVAWGRNNSGQTNVPPGLSNVVAVSAGLYHSLALKTDGTVAAWGRNDSHQCDPPVGLSGVRAIAAGGQHNLALKADRTVVAWGYNFSGEASVPPGLTNVVAISGGYMHSLALTSNGMVTAWGNNKYGQATVPPGLTNVAAIAGAYYHNIALVGGSSLSILAPPQTQVAEPGSTARLNVLVAGTPPFVYQWQHNGTNLIDGGRFTGTTNSTLAIADVGNNDAGNYTVVVSSGRSVLTSQPALLTVSGLLQRLVDEAAPGDTILLPAQTYLDNVVIGKNLTLQGMGATNTIIDGNASGPVFVIRSNLTVTLRDLTIKNGCDRGTNGTIGAAGANASGGGIRNEGSTLTVLNCVLSDNRAEGGIGSSAFENYPVDFYPTGRGGDARGGALHNMGGVVELISCTLSNNFSAGGNGGDAIYWYSLYYIDGAHGGDSYGGAICSDSGLLTITNCTFVDNGSLGGNGGDGGHNNGGSGGAGVGGAVFHLSGTSAISRTSFRSNIVCGGWGGWSSESALGGGYTGAALGGGIASGEGLIGISECTFSDNLAKSVRNPYEDYGGRPCKGGAINNQTATISLCDTLFATNVATAENSSAVGTSCSGGAIYSEGIVNLTNCTFLGNVARGGGYNESVGSNGSGEGGAICNLRAASLFACTLSGNVAEGGTGCLYSGGMGRGGAIFSTGTMALVSSLLSSNIARGFDGGDGTGGGLYNSSECGATNTTFFANLAIGGNGKPGDYGNGNGLGGGLRNDGGASLLEHCTLSWNEAAPGSDPDCDPGIGLGGAVFSSTNAGTVTVRNSIFDQSVSGSNFFGAIVDAGYNLSSDASYAFSAVGSQVEIDPLLGPLADNGGPTLTCALLAGSPAIDAGTSAGTSGFDQRGIARPYDVPGIPDSADGSDIGAFEYDGPPWTIVIIVATDATAGEPRSGQGSGTFTFTRTGDTTAALTMPFTVGGTATQGADYASLGTSVGFGAGVTTVTKTVTGIDDTLVEGDETVEVTLAAAGGYTVGSPSSATVTIKDDDFAVTNTDDSGPGSFRQAILDANAGGGGQIMFSGVSGTIFLTTGELVISNNVTIGGPGHSNLAISGNGNSRVFRIEPGAAASISDLTIRDGRYALEAGDELPGGGGIANAGQLTMINCIVIGNSTYEDLEAYRWQVPPGGAGIYNSGVLTMSDCTVSNNWCSAPDYYGQQGGSGGGIYNINTLTLNRCIFVSNSSGNGGMGFGYGGAGGNGGALYNAGSLMLNACIVNGNVAGNGGDGWMADVTWSGPGSGGCGGGIYNTATLVLNGCSISGNSCGNGGGDPYYTYCPGGDGGSGGGVFNAGTLTVNGCTISDNLAGDGTDGDYGHNFAFVEDGCRGGSGGSGGGICSSGTLNLSNSTISGNSCGDGGNGGWGFYNRYSSGRAGGNGGGGGDGGSGGGIYSAGTLSVENCTLFGNSCGQGGLAGNGGRGSDGDPNLPESGGDGGNGGDGGSSGRGGGISGGGTLNNCTISGNSASGSSTPGGLGGLGGAGGGWAEDGPYGPPGSDGSPGSPGNAGTGGGIYAGGILLNSIVGNNTATGEGPDLYGNFASLGHNLIGNTSGSSGFGVSGDLLNVDPQLGPLTDNGGPTLTCALLLGSPAIDAGTSAGTSGFDQRRVPRPYDVPGIPDSADGSDIGAFEYVGPGCAVTVAATDATAGEPRSVQGSGTFTFSRAGDTTAALTVTFTVGGTATAGADYASIGTSVSFGAEVTTVTKTVTGIDDTLVEGDETVLVTLANGTGYRVGNPNTATVNIEDGTLTLAEALDTPGWTWTTGGNPPAWYGQTEVTHDAVDAARSGAIGDNQTNWMETVVSGPGAVSFWWKVSSELNYDFLRFAVEGVEKARISGEVGWVQAMFPVAGAGNHTLRWAYTKDADKIGVQDAGWVEQVGFTPACTLSVASVNPSSGVSVTVSPSDISGAGNGVTVFTRTYAINTAVTLTAPTTAGANNFQKWQKDGVDFSTAASASVTMDANHTMTAVYAPPTVTVQTSPSGRSFSVDGVSYSSAQTFSWTSGSSHTIATTSPQSGAAGLQYVWTGWSDGGAMSHTVSPTSGTTYTANFKTQYYLTTSAGTGGTVSPASGWYDTSQSVPISASASGGYTFAGWTGSGSGSYSGMNNPANVTMNGPISETASFSAGCVAVNLVTGMTLGTAQNNANRWLGMRLRVGASPLQVSALGRIYINGNVQDHELRVVEVATKATVASVVWTPAGGVTNQIKYAALAASVTLAANTDYDLASREVSGGDRWYHYSTVVTTTADASVLSAVFSDTGTTWTPYSTAGHTYGPVSLQYCGSSTVEVVSVPTGVSGATSTFVGKSEAYTGSGASSSTGHTLQYRFDWGDGTISAWGSASQSYSWSASGTFNIKAQARCATDTGVMSAWSGTLGSVAVSFCTLTTSLSPSGSGSVTKSPNKAGYNWNETVTLTAAASSGYTFSSWIGDASGTANPTTVTMSGNKTVTASFSAGCVAVNLVTGMTLGTAQNNANRWLGMRLRVGASPLQVSALGRIYINGNVQDHELRVVEVATKATVASVVWTPAGGVTNQIKYAALAAPVTLRANTDYDLASREVSGGDRWYHYSTVVTTTADASVLSAVFSDTGTTWTPYSTAGHTYGPVSLQYCGSSSQTLAAIALPVIESVTLSRMLIGEDRAIEIETAKNQIRLSVFGIVGEECRIQGSPDLIEWTDMGGGTIGEAGSFEFTVSSRSELPRKFYRAVFPSRK